MQNLQSKQFAGNLPVHKETFEVFRGAFLVPFCNMCNAEFFEITFLLLLSGWERILLHRFCA